ncbi:uncharacterized protein LOC143538232 [Bidens hawaiensis]|uniref:uncharacterized protein LOC143538232 n=1 Tax=Bidens hawaiensis TaxID=980011 RepID=UPI0040495893
MEKMNEDDWIVRSSPGDGKMVIKLKIPKPSSTATDHGEVKTPEKDVIGILNPVTRVCPECNKEFSSGKALGGHMRVHVQSATYNHKNPNFLKPPKTIKKPAGLYAYNNQDYSSKPYYLNSVNEEGEPTCSQCGKTFPSMKSLFGHMRCHPERVWRGILPPPHTPSPSAARRRDHVVDLTSFLRGWSVTERRGRRSLKPAENNDDGLLEAVEDLMSFANYAAVGNNSPENNVHSSGGNGKAVMEDEDDGEESDNNEQLLIQCKFKNWNPNNKIKKRKRMKLMMELEPTSGVIPLPPIPEPQQQQQQQPVVGSECKYKCTTCNKCFTTHQALGGHRSSHNKPKFESDHKTLILMNVSGENNNLEKEVHQCKTCDKVFATGQALGGHQRCHWSGTSVVQAQSSQVTSAGEGGSQTGSERKVFEFDLNEVPPVMMEEDEGGINGNNGYASSSYNSNIC